MTRAFDRDVMQRMKLLHGVIRRHQAAQPLRGWKVLFIQHQLENHLAQAQAILSLGIDPSDLYWLDIPYTSSPEIREVLQEAGIPGPNFTVHDHNLTQHYATYQRTRTGEWIKRFIKEHGSRVSLLVLDDGGYFLEALIPFREKFDRLAVVEQTMRGIEKLRENIAIRYHYREVPLVDVATSDPKKSIEPAFIAAAVVEATRERLIALKGRIAPPRKILALGYGAIGSAVASKLAEHFGLDRKQVYGFDYDLRKRAQSLHDG